LTEPAQVLDLPLATFSLMGREGANVETGEIAPEVLRATTVTSALFSDELLQERLNSEVIELDPERSVVVYVSNIHEPRDRDYSEVADNVLAMYQKEKAAEKLAAVAEQAKSAVQGGDSLSAFAEANSYEVTKDQLITRRSGELDQNVLQALFSASRNSIGNEVHKATLANGDLFLFTITSIEASDDAMSGELKNVIAQQASAMAARQEMMSLLSQLKQQAEIVDQ
jgi:peptidyl-prolyl cis-trans isomerase D